MIVNALTVDVEDWFQVGAFEHAIAREDWDSLEHRVEANTDRVLDLFARTGVTATFFSLGWVAERYPGLMRRIVDAGHELASHGWDHQRVFTMGPEQFRADLARARAALEDAGGTRVTGYRAPSFSIDPRTPWAHTILAEEGYRYSSSVAPVRHDHYGSPEAPKGAYRPIAGGNLIELPVTTTRFLGREITAGGGFFRLLPGRVTATAVRDANRADRAAIFYFHPWEIDPGQPRVAGIDAKTKFRHYVNISRTEARIAQLLSDLSWGRMDHIFLGRG